MFRRVAAALPGMENNQEKQNKDDSILATEERGEREREREGGRGEGEGEGGRERGDRMSSL